MAALDGKLAPVTGGSKGLGAATARLFAEAGTRVVVTFASDGDAAACDCENRAAARRIARLPLAERPPAHPARRCALRCFR